MTTTVVFWTIAVPLITFAVVGLCWLISRARAADAERNRFLFGPARRPGMPYLAARWDDDAEQWVNEEPHDLGPDNLRLLEDLEAHLKAYGASVADLYDTTTGD